MSEIVSAKIEIASKDPVTGEWQRTVAQQDVVTDHIQAYYNELARVCGNAEVSPICPDVFVPSAIGLYNDPKAAETGVHTRDRGELTGWAALGYDYHNNDQSLQGSRVISQYKTEAMENGYIKHTRVAEFGTAHANGTINKLRLYGSRMPQYCIGNRGNRVDYLQLTRFRPYLTNYGHSGYYTAVRSANFGWTDEYKLNRDTGNNSYRAFKKSIYICGEYALHFKSSNGNESTFEIHKLQPPTVSDGRTEMPAGELVGTFKIPFSDWETYVSTCWKIDANGDVFGIVRMNNMLYYHKYTRASNYTKEEVGMLPWAVPGITLGWNNSNWQFAFDNDGNIVVATRNRWNLTGKDEHHIIFTTFDKTTLRQLKYQIYLDMWYDTSSTYQAYMQDFWVTPQGDYSIMNGMMSRHSYVFSFPNMVYRNVETPDLTIDRINYVSIHTMGRGNDYYDTDDPYHWYSTYCSYSNEPFFHRNGEYPRVDHYHHPVQSNYDPTRCAIACYTKSGCQIAFQPWVYIGKDMILAESVIPEINKTEEQAIRVVFEYITKTTFEQPA